MQGDFQDGEPLPNVLFRVYKLKTYRSEQGGRKLPRVELEETGPRLDFKIGRIQSASPEMEKEALKKAKNLEFKTAKNVEVDSMGDKFGTIHMGKQELNKLQTRKLKGLKSKFDQITDDGAEMEEYMNDEEEDINQTGEDAADDTYGEDFVTATDIEVAEPPSKRQKK